MQIIQSYKEYFKNLQQQYQTALTFGIENIADVLEGVFRTSLTDSKYLFILFKPIVRPVSDNDTLNAILQGGFMILKSINLRDSDTDDITATLNEAGSITLDFIIRSMDDSRNGDTFWQYGFNTLDNGELDIEEMAFGNQMDGSFLGYKTIFSIQIPMMDCQDFSERVSPQKWKDK